MEWSRMRSPSWHDRTGVRTAAALGSLPSFASRGSGRETHPVRGTQDAGRSGTPNAEQPSGWSTLGPGEKAALVVGALIVLVGVVKFLPQLLASIDGLQGKEKAEEAGRIRTALLALGAGLLAAVGAFYTARSYQLNRQGQITDRFTNAIEQLGSKELAVRLGGIYALERIARDSPDYRSQIMEVLTAYVRERAPWRPGPEDDHLRWAAGPEARGVEGHHPERAGDRRSGRGRCCRPT